MKIRRSTLALTTCLALLAAPARANAAPGDAPAFDAPSLGDKGTGETASRKIGLNVELELATAFIFRGYNLFGAGAQQDQHLMLTPAVDWAIFDSGFTVGYWGSYQLTGDNIEANIDAAVGAEQGLYAHYERELAQNLTLSGMLVWYFYPAAGEATNGVSFPCILEPGVGLRYFKGVGMGLNLSYLAALQSELSAISYLYINPVLDRMFELHRVLYLQLQLGFGVKVFTGRPETVPDNMFDVTTSAILIWNITDVLFTTATFGLAWTNLGDRETTDATGQPVTEELGFADEVGLFAGLKLGVEL